MKAAAWVLLFFCLGCAADEPDSPAERLIGAWVADLAPAAPCGFGYMFGADGRYEAAFICRLASGGAGAELEEGAFTVEGDALFFEPDRSSCRSMRSGAPYESDFSFPSEKTLRMRTSSGLVVFERLESGDPSGGALAFGCNEDGQFTPEDVGRF